MWYGDLEIWGIWDYEISKFPRCREIGLEDWRRVLILLDDKYFSKLFFGIVFPTSFSQTTCKKKIEKLIFGIFWNFSDFSEISQIFRFFWNFSDFRIFWNFQIKNFDFKFFQIFPPTFIWIYLGVSFILFSNYFSKLISPA